MDAHYFQSIALGLGNVLAWPTFGFLLIGIAVGLVIGALPAIGGVTGLIVLLPFTYSMSGPSAFALLLGMYATVAAGDSISSILIGVPGGVGSAATILDGYPMTQRGEGSRALGAAYAACLLGGLIGAGIVALSVPIVKPLVKAFGMPEYFAITILGIVMVGTLAGRSIAKGIAVACLGLVVAAMGASDFSGVPRFWFDQTYLLQGPPLVAIILGMFGIAEMLEMAVKNESLARTKPIKQNVSGTLMGVMDAWRNKLLVLRSSAIGVGIGILPGLGSSVVDWLAYGHAVQSAKDKSQFGKGDVRGVIAPEVANNSERGGAMVPTLAFGIPGDFAMAILLGALTIQGLKPGIDMLTTQLPMTFTMVWTMVLANLIGTVLLLLWSRQVARIAFINGHLIVPTILLFMFMGAWFGTGGIGDLVVMLVASIVGYWMKISGWPRPPIIIALVLGPIIENSLIVSMRTYDGFSFLLRPSVFGILAIAAVTVMMIVRNRIRASRRAVKEPQAGDEPMTEIPVFSWPLAMALVLVFGACVFASLQMKHLNGIFPLIGGSMGLLCVALALFDDSRLILASLHHKQLAAQLREAARAVLLARGLLFLVFIAMTVLGVYLLGNKIAIALAIGFYVLAWGRYAWWVGAIFGIAAYAIIELLYDRALHISLQTPFWQ
jgi:TctA family transporter